MTSSLVLIGIDPGMKESGFVRLVGGEPDEACVISRDKNESRAAYLKEVLDVVDEYATGVKNPLICVEDVNPPKPFFKGKQSITNTKSIIETAAVIGADPRALPGSLRRSPGANNGQGYLPAYPPMLVGERVRPGKAFCATPGAPTTSVRSCSTTSRHQREHRRHVPTRRTDRPGDRRRPRRPRHVRLPERNGLVGRAA